MSNMCLYGSTTECLKVIGKSEYIETCRNEEWEEKEAVNENERKRMLKGKEINEVHDSKQRDTRCNGVVMERTKTYLPTPRKSSNTLATSSSFLNLLYPSLPLLQRLERVQMQTEPKPTENFGRLRAWYRVRALRLSLSCSVLAGDRTRVRA